MLCCSGYYPNPTLHFKAYGPGLLPGERPRCPTENDIAVFLRINALLKWVLQLTQNAPTFLRNQDSDRRRRKSDKWVDGNSSLSLSSHPLKKEKKNPDVQPTQINPSFRLSLTQGVVFFPPPRGWWLLFPKLEMGLNPDPSAPLLSAASVELLQMKTGPEHRHMNDCLFGGQTQSPTEWPS